MSDTAEARDFPERKKIRDENERRDLMNRLKRIEGQVRGLQRMLDENAYCPDLLTQASAVSSALGIAPRISRTSAGVTATELTFSVSISSDQS